VTLGVWKIEVVPRLYEAALDQVMRVRAFLPELEEIVSYLVAPTDIATGAFPCPS